MKKLLLSIVLLAGITAGSLFAWDPSYLLTYPKCTKGGDWQLNLGVGFPWPGEDFKVFIPPVRVSLDKNTPLGDAGLPFFFGGLLAYRGNIWEPVSNTRYIIHNIDAGVRFGYHFNWDVDKLDTYAVTTAGFGFRLHNVEKGRVVPGYNAWPVLGINLGARWYVTNGFGFWAELGLSHATSLFPHADIGLVFKW